MVATGQLWSVSDSFASHGHLEKASLLQTATFNQSFLSNLLVYWLEETVQPVLGVRVSDPDLVDICVRKRVVLNQTLESVHAQGTAGVAHPVPHDHRRARACNKDSIIQGFS